MEQDKNSQHTTDEETLDRFGCFLFSVVVLPLLIIVAAMLAEHLQPHVAVDLQLVVVLVPLVIVIAHRAASMVQIARNWCRSGFCHRWRCPLPHQDDHHPAKHLPLLPPPIGYQPTENSFWIDPGDFGILETMVRKPCDRSSTARVRVSTRARDHRLRAIRLEGFADVVVSPRAKIGDWTFLEALEVSHTELDRLPPSVGRLKHLKVLNLAGATRTLEKLPKELGDLASLTTLVLSHSGMVRLPSSIGKLHNLEDLDLSHTPRLSILPDEIGTLASLKRWNLAHSGILSLPASIVGLVSLCELHLTVLHLPEEIGDLASLRVLNLSHSGVMLLPASIGRLRHLRVLLLSNTSHLATLPDTIGDLPSLFLLDLHASSIRYLPPSIGRLKSLHLLDLSNTSYLTHMPEEVGRLTRLRHLYLYGSGIGNLPISVGGTRYLREPRISDARDASTKTVGSWNESRHGTSSHSDPLPGSVLMLLACDRARIRVSMVCGQEGGKWWPMILDNAEGAFAEWPMAPNFDFHHRQCERGTDSEFWNPPRPRIPSPDALYNILVEGRESFVAALVAR